jgi:hypothetical protein
VRKPEDVEFGGPPDSRIHRFLEYENHLGRRRSVDRPKPVSLVNVRGLSNAGHSPSAPPHGDSHETCEPEADPTAISPAPSGRYDMDEYDESSGESNVLDVSDSIASGLGSIVDGVVDTAGRAASLARHTADLGVDLLQMEAHQEAASWAAGNSDMNEAIYQNYAGDVEFNEMTEDAAKIVHEDLGF